MHSIINMNINKIKEKIIKLKNNKIKIKVYLGRNKYEYYIGQIEKIYPNIFSVKTDKGIKTFSFSDVAISVVVLTLAK